MGHLELHVSKWGIWNCMYQNGAFGIACIKMGHLELHGAFGIACIKMGHLELHVDKIII